MINFNNKKEKKIDVYVTTNMSCYLLTKNYLMSSTNKDFN